MRTAAPARCAQRPAGRGEDRRTGNMDLSYAWKGFVQFAANTPEDFVQAALAAEVILIMI